MSKLKQLLFGLNEADRRVIEEKLKEKDKEISKLQASCKSAISSFVRMETLYGIESKKVDLLNEQLAEKDKKLLEFKRDRLYFELLLTRLQWLHKKADDYRQEKERFGIADMSLSSVWDVLELQKNGLCEYEEMCALQEGIECIANSKLLADIEHDLEIKVTRNENEIFKDIELIDNQIKVLKGE